jgi:hypothetical protein
MKLEHHCVCTSLSIWKAATRDPQFAVDDLPGWACLPCLPGHDPTGFLVFASSCSLQNEVSESTRLQTGYVSMSQYPSGALFDVLQW